MVTELMAHRNYLSSIHKIMLRIIFRDRRFLDMSFLMKLKVISRLLWNSRSQKIVGLSMSHSEQVSLADIYQLLKESQYALLYICNVKIVSFR